MLGKLKISCVLILVVASKLLSQSYIEYNYPTNDIWTRLGIEGWDCFAPTYDYYITTILALNGTCGGYISTHYEVTAYAIPLNLSSTDLITSAFIELELQNNICGGILRTYSIPPITNPYYVYASWINRGTEDLGVNWFNEYYEQYDIVNNRDARYFNSIGLNHLNFYKTGSAWIIFGFQNTCINNYDAGLSLIVKRIGIYYYSLPSAPTLNNPLNNASLYTTSVNFSWNAPSQGATSYTLQVSKYSNFSTFVYNNTVTSTSQTVSGLEYGTTYYWRVNATNPAGTSSWSEVRTFNIVSLSKNNKPILQTIMQTR